MIIDKLAEFADAVALSQAGTGAAQLGDAIDLGVARDVGNGQPLYLIITVDTAVTSGGSATVEFQIRSDSTANLDTSTSSLHGSTGAIPVASLSQGAGFCMALPLAGIDYERYLGVVAVVGTAALTAGKVNAFLSIDQYGWKPYAEGQN